MPGVYVRKASWLDWTQTRENSILTVPGSYWLCHKSNIYKFIFRYHRITRNVKQFSFGKELMKVVRRIIKNQPRQGQQFGTTHLLVTYSYASWTRQDKMFAMIKFKERSVAAFSHAFVLTIKVCCPLESTDQSTKRTNGSHTDQCLIPPIESSKNARTHENKIERKREKDLLHSYNNDTSGKKAWRDDTQEKILESENKESAKQKTDNKNTDKFNKSSGDCTNKLKEEHGNEDVNNSMLLDSNSIIIKEDGIDEADDARYSNDFIYLEKTKNKIEKLCVEKINVNITAQQIEKESIDSITNLLSSNSNENIVDDTNTDSVNLPYQYLIEKEIENAKHEVSDFKNCWQETTKTTGKSPCNQHEQNSRKHKLEELNEGTKDLPSPKKRKCTVDNNITPRSSDITDLVMEGLMFTIRQGQDTVAVIEQKTKLEVDEVLENSEKIETQEGEKCLRNSSLLGLENLITMIDLPKEIENGHKCQNTIIQNNILSNHPFDTVKYPVNDVQSKSSCNNFSLAGTSFSSINENPYITNNRQYLTIDDVYKFEENVNFSKHRNLKLKKEEEEEDIIPEILQNNTFQSPIHSLKEIYEFKEKFMENDKCTSFLSKNLLPVKCLNACSSNEVTNTSITDKSPELYNNIKNKINAPTIISNQTISMKEIPLPLQKILRRKLSTNYISLINSNETDESNIKVYKEVAKTQSHQEEKILFNVQSEIKSLNSKNDRDNDENERMSATASEIEIKCDGTSEKNSEKVEKMLPNKLQDITEEFYQDLSYLQKKKHSHNDKYLGSRTKLLNESDDINYDEMHVEMVKLFQDITRGAKVVVTRISAKECS